MVQGNLSVGDRGNVAAIHEKLHNLLALSRQLCPTGVCAGVLLHATEGCFPELEIHFAQFRLARATDSITCLAECYRLCLHCERLLLDGHYIFLQVHRLAPPVESFSPFMRNSTAASS